MAISRYSLTSRLNFGFQYGTSETVNKIRSAVNSGLIQTETIILQEIVRLDVLAGKIYGDGRYYWLIAAASDIGWALQVPPNTRIVVPNLEQSLRYLG